MRRRRCGASNRAMGEAFATSNEGQGLSHEPHGWREDGASSVVATTDVAARRTDVVAPERLALVVADMISQPAPPADVLDLLISTARFAQAIVELDLGDPDKRAERICFDALAALKRSLRQVTWSRALE